VPRASGVLSALGLAISDLRRDYVRPLLGRLDQLEEAVPRAAWRELEDLARKELAASGEQPDLTRRADLRYRGQSFELTVDVAEVEDLGERFHQAHG
jgi:N-methylhydantoinase A